MGKDMQDFGSTKAYGKAGVDKEEVIGPEEQIFTP